MSTFCIQIYFSVVNFRKTNSTENNDGIQYQCTRRKNCILHWKNIFDLTPTSLSSCIWIPYITTATAFTTLKWKYILKQCGQERHIDHKGVRNDVVVKQRPFETYKTGHYLIRLNWYNTPNPYNLLFVLSYRIVKHIL